VWRCGYQVGQRRSWHRTAVRPRDITRSAKVLTISRSEILVPALELLAKPRHSVHRGVDHRATPPEFR
jgi:hypothetical protein